MSGTLRMKGENYEKRKPGPSRKLSYLDEFLLVLIRLKAGLFFQDLADRFEISTSLVSRICNTWINLLYFEIQDMFLFPTREHVRKNMAKEFAQYATTRIILDCTELFIQQCSAMLAQSETNLLASAVENLPILYDKSLKEFKDNNKKKECMATSCRAAGFGVR